MPRRNKPGKRDAVRHEMVSKVRPDVAEAERLLSGSPGTDSELAMLIAAASAPARSEELGGEDDAVLAFRTALRDARPPVATHRYRPHRSRWAWALVAKVAALVLATAGAGWALAATTGVVPAPWQDQPVAPISTSTPAKPPVTAPPSSRTTGTPTSPPTPTPPSTPGPPSTVPTPDTPPSADASLRGLCQAFVAQGSDPDNLNTPAFARLVEAAGGVDQVPAFCTVLLESHPIATESPAPTVSGT